MRSRPARHTLHRFHADIPLFYSLLWASLCLLPIIGFPQNSQPVPVYVVKAGITPVIETLPLSGTFTSENSAALSPRVSGLVTRVNVDAGDKVKTGDVLVELDSVLAKLELNRDRAALNEARSALKEANRLSDEARDLAKNKNIPKTTVQARIADVDMKTAALARLEAEYNQQQEVINRHTVIAPFAGVVSRKLTEVGEWVETGSAVIDLVANKRLRLDVQAPQEYHQYISENTPVTVKLDTATDKEYQGKILTTVPVNNPNARTFLIRILVDEAKDLVIPGMSAQAIFKIQLEQEALQLPRDAIIQYPDGRNSIWVVKENNGKFIASEQQVQIGRSMSQNVIIRKGLLPGSIVVVRGNETLQEGQQVKILEPSTADNTN